MEQQVHRAHKGQQDLKVPRVSQVQMVLMGKTELQGHKDQQDPKGLKVSKDQRELTDKTAQSELQDQADPQDPQGHKVLLVPMDKTVCYQTELMLETQLIGTEPSGL